MYNQLEEIAESNSHLQQITLPWIRQGRVQYLDGLRAVAIAFVIASHAAPATPFKLFAAFVLWSRIGHLGVSLFFVISGFLISLLLFREMDRVGKISLRQFYSRRILRIMPAYFTYIIIMFAVTRVIDLHIRSRNWITASLFCVSLDRTENQSWQLGHLWSLSVEEHFYLLWPILIALCSVRSAVIVASFYVMITPVLRYFIQLHVPQLDIEFASPVEMSTIAVGCLCAYAVFTHNVQISAYFRSNRARLFLFGGMAGLFGSTWLGHRVWHYQFIFGDPVNSILLGLVLLGIFYGGGGVIARQLNSKPMRAIGILSYSLYLWQQPFTYKVNYWAVIWPWNIIFPVIAAPCSYFIVERPFLLMKERVGSRRRATVNGEKVLGSDA